MNRFLRKLALVGLLWLPISCSTTPGGSAGGTKEVALKTPPPSAAVNYSLSASAGPDELARQALAHHPSIAAARHRAERLEAKVAQEWSLPDPQLELAAGSMAETAAGRMDATGALKQKLPFPGKRAAAASAASSEAAAARSDVKALELKLTEQVHAAWWDYYFAAQTIRLTRESQALLEVVRDAVDASVAADQASQADQLRIANQLSMIDRDLAEAGKLESTARARLNSLLNRPAGSPLPTSRRSAVPTSGTLDSLLTRSQYSHPEVAAAELRAKAFQHRLKRAELEKYPDFTAGVGGAAVSSSGLAPSANGRDQVWASLGINIPLWQEPRKAMIREAQQGIAETEAMLAAKRSDLRYRVEEAWYRAKTAVEIAMLFETRLIPDARQAYEISLSSYSVDKASFNDLVETWRLLLSYQLQLANNHSQLGKAAATLRAAAAIH